MKVEKDKKRVCVICTYGSLARGFVHVNPGLRIIDFLNDQREEFIALTSADFSNLKEVHSFKLINELQKKRDVVILSKKAIKWVEQI